MTRTQESGLFAAKQFGAEYQANPGSSRAEYLDASAHYFGQDKESFTDLTKEEKAACLQAFEKGIKAEKEFQ